MPANTFDELKYQHVCALWAAVREKYLEGIGEDPTVIPEFLTVLQAYIVARDAAHAIDAMVKGSKDEAFREANGLEGELTLDSFDALDTSECESEEIKVWASEVGSHWPERIIGFLSDNPQFASELIDLFADDEDQDMYTEVYEKMSADWAKIHQVILDHDNLEDASAAFIPMMLFKEFTSELGEITLNGGYFNTEHSRLYDYFLGLCSTMASTIGPIAYVDFGGTHKSAAYMAGGTNYTRAYSSSTITTVRKLMDTASELGPTISNAMNNVSSGGLMGLMNINRKSSG